jgi:hypothetical protein
MGCLLGENILALQVERLLLAFALGSHLFCEASSVFTYKSGVDLRLLHGVCHLLLHGFTFLNDSSKIAMSVSKAKNPNGCFPKEIDTLHEAFEGTNVVVLL